MTSFINATTSSGVVLTPDNSGNILLQYNGQSAPAFSAYQSSAQTNLTSNNFSKILFQTESFDTNNNFASSTFTPTVAGYYQLNASVQVNSTTSGARGQVCLYKNGVHLLDGTASYGGSSQYPSSTGSFLVYANGTTDYFEVYCYGTDNGSNYSTAAVDYRTYFQGCLMRGA